jgi:tight adherence protein B
LWLVAPTYYGQVWNEPLVKPVLGGAVAWMMIGNLIMYRMVKFSI